MSRLIAIMGESGAGKTTSLRNLPSNETLYIDCDGKGLAWKGWRNQYNAENKNYIKTRDVLSIQTYLQAASEKRPHIKYVVIDTINALMVADEMARMKEKTFDKWQDLAQCIYYIVVGANDYREDLTIILVAHTQTDMDDNGYMFTHIKTNGKKLNKICLEAYMPVVLLAKRSLANGYVFEVHSLNSSAKTPMGAFDTDEVPNDIMEVLKVLEEY